MKEDEYYDKLAERKSFDDLTRTTILTPFRDEEFFVSGQYSDRFQ